MPAPLVPCLSLAVHPAGAYDMQQAPPAPKEPAWITLTNQVSGVPGWPDPRETGDNSSGPRPTLRGVERQATEVEK